MSIKNQRPLIIFASVIIGLTVASLFGLNLLVDHIAKISPPSIPMAAPARPPTAEGLGADDAIDRGQPPSPIPPGFQGRPPRPDMMQRPKMPDMRDRPTEDAMRRVRNGKDAPDLRRTAPRAPNGRDDAAIQKNGMPAYPQDMANGYYPPPYQMQPPQMDPKERERIEQEMQRRREMYYSAPPPGYYPPPYQPEDSYNGQNYDPYEYEDYYEDYDGYEDWESKYEVLDDDSEKTAEKLGDYVYDQEVEDEGDRDVVEEYEDE
jgi:hypothetical protein